MATRIGVELWNKWVPVRKESAADGTTSLYFGIGRLWWRRPPKPYDPDTWPTMDLTDEEFEAFTDAIKGEPDHRVLGPGESLFACTVCGKWFIQLAINASCTVAHSPGSCCHYGHEEVTGTVNLTPNPW